MFGGVDRVLLWFYGFQIVISLICSKSVLCFDFANRRSSLASE